MRESPRILPLLEISQMYQLYYPGRNSSLLNFFRKGRFVQNEYLLAIGRKASAISLRTNLLIRSVDS